MHSMYMCTHVNPVAIWMVGIKEAPMFIHQKSRGLTILKSTFKRAKLLFKRGRLILNERGSPTMVQYPKEPAPGHMSHTDIEEASRYKIAGEACLVRFAFCIHVHAALRSILLDLPSVYMFMRPLVLYMHLPCPGDGLAHALIPCISHWTIHSLPTRSFPKH